MSYKLMIINGGVNRGGEGGRKELGGEAEHKLVHAVEDQLFSHGRISSHLHHELVDS